MAIKQDSPPEEANQRFIQLYQTHQYEDAWQYAYAEYKAFIALLFKRDYRGYIGKDEYLQVDSVVDEVFVELHTMIQDKSIEVFLGLSQDYQTTNTLKKWLKTLWNKFTKRENTIMLKGLLANILYVIVQKRKNKWLREEKKLYRPVTNDTSQGLDGLSAFELKTDTFEEFIDWEALKQKEQYQKALLETFKTKTGKETRHYVVLKALFELDATTSPKQIRSKVKEILAANGFSNTVSSIDVLLSEIKNNAEAFFDKLPPILFVLLIFYLAYL